MLRCYEPAHIVGVSKTAYAPATPRCLDWRRDLQRTSTNDDPPDPDSQAPSSPACWSSSRRSPRSLGDQLPASSSSTAPRPSTSAPLDVPRSEHRGALGEADGAVPDGTTVFDDEIPGVANLDSDLLGALRQAATDAADDGVEFVVDSGWRSPAYQEQLLRRGGREVRLGGGGRPLGGHPDTSAHVSGDAVDIGPSDATAWLSEHGAAYGLCQIYGNEPWHYELRPEAVDRRLPAHVRRPDARSEDAAVTRARPLAALALVALIGAGCSSAPAETEQRHRHQDRHRSRARR